MRSNEMPKASIIITHWNRAQHLVDLSTSILRSSVQNNEANLIAEVIVVDSPSASSAAVRQQLQGITEQYTTSIPLKTIYLSENRGPSFARSQGLNVATGDYIQFLDDDDWIAPEKLSTQLCWASNHRDADVIASVWAKVPYSAQIGDVHAVELQTPDFGAPLALSVLEKFTPLMACLLKRSALLAIDAFQEGYWLVEDVHLQLKLISNRARFTIAPSTVPLFLYRSSPPTASLSTAADRLPFWEACLRNLRLAESILGPDPSLLGSEQRRLAVLYGQLARGVFPRDRQLFSQILTRIAQLDPHYIPTGPPALRVASKLLGYPRAEQLNYWTRRLRNRLPRRR